LGAGFLEKVYERAMFRDLTLRGVSAKTQASFPVCYKAVDTYTLALWERDCGQFLFANAGGKSAAIVREGRIVRIAVSGQWLGWFPNVDYEEVAVPVQAGDLLVLASEGIPDQENPAVAPYEDESFSRFLAGCSGLSALEVAQGILIDVERFADGRPQEDDQTILVAKVL